MHGAAWRPLKYCLKVHGATVNTLNTARAAQRPFKYSPEMHGAAWTPLKYYLKMHETSWNHCVDFKYYRSRMKTL